MKELQTILDKLSKLTFTKEKGTDVLTTKKGFRVSLYTQYHHSKSGGRMVSCQVILDVRYKGARVSSWGCSEVKDTQMVVDWFIETKNKVHDAEWNETKENEKIGTNIFDSLEFKQ